MQHEGAHIFIVMQGINTFADWCPSKTRTFKESDFKTVFFSRNAKIRKLQFDKVNHCLSTMDIKFSTSYFQMIQFYQEDEDAKSTSDYGTDTAMVEREK